MGISIHRGASLRARPFSSAPAATRCEARSNRANFARWASIDPATLAVGDIVLCKVNGGSTSTWSRRSKAEALSDREQSGKDQWLDISQLNLREIRWVE